MAVGGGEWLEFRFHPFGVVRDEVVAAVVRSESLGSLNLCIHSDMSVDSVVSWAHQRRVSRRENHADGCVRLMLRGALSRNTHPVSVVAVDRWCADHVDSTYVQPYPSHRLQRVHRQLPHRVRPQVPSAAHGISNAPTGS